MGRAERPLNPEAGAVERFAYDLRQLRQQAGAPPYRKLASQTNYSVTSLSQAAAGRMLPSLAVTRAFVRACGGDPDEWDNRWHEAAAAATPTGSQGDPVGRKLSADSAVPTESVDDTKPAPRKSTEPLLRRLRVRLRPRPVVVVTTAIAVTVAAPIVAAVLWAGTPSPAASSVLSLRQLGQANPVADGADPGRAGCNADAVTMAATRVHFPVSQLSGQIELRYSPHCHAAWARFEPNPGWNPGPGTMVTVWTLRPADEATQTYSVEFGGESVFGNMLMTAPGCIEAEATMARGQATAPIAETPCVPIN